MSKLRSLMKTKKRPTRRVRTVLAEIVAHSDGADEAQVRIPPAYHAALGLPASHDGVVTASFRELSTNKKSPNFHDFADRAGRRVTGKLKREMPCDPGDWLRFENVQADGKDRISTSWMTIALKCANLDEADPDPVVDGLVRFAPLRAGSGEIDPETTRWRASVADLASATPLALDATEISNVLSEMLHGVDRGQAEAILRIHDKETGAVVGAFIARHWNKETNSLEPAANAVERAVAACLDTENLDEAVAKLRGEDMDLVLEAVPVTSFPAGGYLREQVSKAVQPGSNKERYGAGIGNVAMIKDSSHFGWSPGAVLCRNMPGDDDRRPLTIATSVAMQNTIGYPMDAFDSPNTSGARKSYMANASASDATESSVPAVEESQDSKPETPEEMNAVEEAVSAALEEDRAPPPPSPSTAAPSPFSM